jgi:hypothetical protein
MKIAVVDRMAAAAKAIVYPRVRCERSESVAHTAQFRGWNGGWEEPIPRRTCPSDSAGEGQVS